MRRRDGGRVRKDEVMGRTVEGRRWVEKNKTMFSGLSQDMVALREWEKCLVPPRLGTWILGVVRI